MIQRNKTTQVMMAFALFMACIGTVSCSLVSTNLVNGKDPKGAVPSVSSPIESLNPELLEQDATLFRNTPKSIKGLTLSTAWLAKSKDQSAYTSRGAIASMLRAAHIALSVFSAEGCEQLDSTVCKSLSAVHREATFMLFSILQTRSWVVPNLEPSRYRLSQKTGTELPKLQSWELYMPESLDSLKIDRAGIGLPLTGCRKVARTLVCSPLTAVITFQDSLSSDTITADISVLDAYQQEVVSIDSSPVPLAANFSSSIDVLIHQNVPPLSLACLSTPTSLTGVALLPLPENDDPKVMRKFLNSMVYNPQIRNGYTACLFKMQPVSSVARRNKQALKILSNMKTLLEADFSTGQVRLALINLSPKSIALSTLIANNLKGANAKALRLSTIGMPTYMPPYLHEYDTLEEVASMLSAQLFTTGIVCEQECVSALGKSPHIVESLGSANSHSQSDKTLKYDSFRVSAPL